MSEFEKKFPKPGKTNIEWLDEIATRIWKSNRSGWLEALKWMWEQRTSNYEHMSFVKIKKEIEAIEQALKG